MRTGFSIYSFWNAFRKREMTVEEAFSFMHDHGAQATEIADFSVPLHEGLPGPFRVLGYDPDMERKLVEYADKYQVPMSAYSCGSDISRGQGDDYKRMMEHLQGEIELARRLGIPLIRIDLVRVMVGKDDVGIEAYEQLFEQAVTAARFLADYAAQYGMMVTVENHGTLMNGADRIHKLVRAVNKPNYGVTLDLGNTVCVDEDPVFAARDLIGLAKEIHVKDFYIRNDPYAIGAKFKDGYTVADPGVLGNGSWLTTKHLRYLRGAIVGHGDLPMRDLIRTVIHSEFSGDILIEFEGMEDPRIACELSLSNLRHIIELEKQD